MAQETCVLDFVCPAYVIIFYASIQYLILYRQKTLEINDFRHNLKRSSSNNYASRQLLLAEPRQHLLTPHRYIAALVAARLGFRDALLDWAIVYTFGYSVVAGFTWKDADPNSLLVLWGLSVMVAAGVYLVLGVRIPQWVSQFMRVLIDSCYIFTCVIFLLFFVVPCMY